MRKHIIYHTTNAFMLMAAATILSACDLMHEDIQDDSGGQASKTSYISLTFSTATSGNGTRSNPTGGEGGDGKEAGQSYENEINNATAFLFQAEKNGINASGETEVTKVYFEQLPINSGNVHGTGAVETTLEAGTYNILAATNLGDIDLDANKDGKQTLAEVRDYIQKSAWSEEQKDNTTSYKDFVMSSEANATITINANNDKDNPAETRINVERMAARIDYKTEGELTCEDPQYENAKVKITGACIVNNLTAGSYLMKRVADDVQGTNLSYLGEEVYDATNKKYNYVIDPWTASKTTENIASGFTIGGTSGKGAKDLFGIYWGDTNATNPNWWASNATAGTELIINDETWNRIGYTLENTTAASESSHNYNTTVVFKAKFLPVGISKYKEGSTFFASGNHLFASMEDMMSYFYVDNFANFDTNIEKCETWNDVKTFATKLLDNDPSGYKTFLESEAKDKTDNEKPTNLDALKWSNYMSSVCGYSAELSEGTYTITLDQNKKVTAQELAKYNTRTYKDATCYYTWWVRHANDGKNETNGIMEFAIVRNNIYKLNVKSVYSIGGYIPGDENIVVDVYVKDWTLLDKEELEM